MVVFMDGIEKAQIVEVSSLADLARLAVTMLSFAVIMPIYRYLENYNEVYFVQTTYRDYFRFYGVPIVYLYRAKLTDNSEKVKYVLIKVDETGEKVEVGDRTKPGWTSIPIITLKEKPSFLP
ncbi:MAG: hypothetical protein ACP5HK_00160 [Acidilobus sp.]